MDRKGEKIAERRVGSKWIRIATPQSDSNARFRIDGKENIAGADGFGWPDRELKLFVVRWGEKTLNIPRRFYRDYYWLLLYTVDETKRNSDIGGCWTRVQFDAPADTLLITANGGGGEGWYRATWAVTRDGKIETRR